MAVAPCPDCGNQCSTLAKACPSCGRPVVKEQQYQIPASPLSSTLASSTADEKSTIGGKKKSLMPKWMVVGTVTFVVTQAVGQIWLHNQRVKVEQPSEDDIRCVATEFPNGITKRVCTNQRTKEFVDPDTHEPVNLDLETGSMTKKYQ